MVDQNDVANFREYIGGRKASEDSTKPKRYVLNFAVGSIDAPEFSTDPYIKEYRREVLGPTWSFLGDHSHLLIGYLDEDGQILGQELFTDVLYLKAVEVGKKLPHEDAD